MVSMLGPSFITDSNICIPKYANVRENLNRLAEFQPIENDIFLCSYPKSGTHWVNEIISMLVSGVTEYLSDPLNNLESGNYGDHSRGCRRILHTHLPYDLLPNSILQKKITYVMRDPRDQIVSLYHHHQGLKWSPSLSFKEFFKDVLENANKVEYGNWFRNAYQWWLTFRYSDNVLFLFYEDLKIDLHSQIQRIVKFYNLNVTPDFIIEVTKKTSFSEMKNNKPVGEWFTQWHKESFSIYRKGAIGNWQYHFTPEMIDAFQLFASRMVQNCQYPINYISPSIVSKHTDTVEVLERTQKELAMAH